ncbi:hypothetical protein RCL1_004261 [Eukaryota sp. TZLM3-RCL]
MKYHPPPELFSFLNVLKTKVDNNSSHFAVLNDLSKSTHLSIEQLTRLQEISSSVHIHFPLSDIVSQSEIVFSSPSFEETQYFTSNDEVNRKQYASMVKDVDSEFNGTPSFKPIDSITFILFVFQLMATPVALFLLGYFVLYNWFSFSSRNGISLICFVVGLLIDITLVVIHSFPKIGNTVEKIKAKRKEE